MRGRCPLAWLGLGLAVLVAVAPLSPGSLAQQAPHDAQPWTVEHEVTATVQDHYARVTVGATIEADAPGPAFTFEVPVPDDALVSGLSVTRNGSLHEAEVQPRDQARETFEAAEREQRSAALVEDVRGASMYRYAVNVAPEETVHVELTYERYLTADDGYELELVAPGTQRGQDAGASFDVRLHHTRGITSLASPTGFTEQPSEEGRHLVRELGPREHGNATRVNLTYQVPPSPTGGDLVATVHDGTGYFAHRIQADAGQARLPVDLALVLDRSGSMDGAKIDQLRTAARELVDHLDAEDRLHLTTFSSEARSTWDGFRPVDEATAADVHETLEHMEAQGSTHIAEAIREGMAPFGAEDGEQRFVAVAFLTDGKATAGITSNEQLRVLAQETNTAQAHVFGLAFGEGADWGLVHGLAADAEGYAERVPAGEGADVDLERFLTRLGAPVLANVTVDYEHASVESWRLGAPVVFAGDELVHVGTFDPELSHLNASVTAAGAEQAVDAEISEPVPEHGPTWLPRLVDHQRVRQLEDRLDAHGPDEQLEQRIQDLALEHGFVTSQTSLVVDLPRATPAEDLVHETSELARDQSAPHDGARQDAADEPETMPTEAAETPALGSLAGLAVLATALLACRRTRTRP